MDQSTLKYYSDNAAQVAERYESVVSNLSDHFAAAFSKGGRILDIGCGSGRDLAVLHELGFECYGVDPTPEFVAIAQRNHPELVGRIELGELPVFQTQFDGDFDGVLCSAVLMHIDIEQLPATTAAIKSCLKQGGRLLYSVPSKRLDVVASNRDANGRLFIPDQAVRLNSLFSNLGFIEIQSWTNSDSMGRDAVEWVSVLLELQAA
jgi:2-polyprenyl-3-methyl-5-hydroxy-6-metoxy-1,4-benzoquinol methylase